MTLCGFATTRWNELLIQQCCSVGVEVAYRHTLVRVILRDDFSLLCYAKPTVYCTRWLRADGTESTWVATARNGATFAMKQRQLYPVFVCSSDERFLPSKM